METDLFFMLQEEFKKQEEFREEVREFISDLHESFIGSAGNSEEDGSGPEIRAKN